MTKREENLLGLAPVSSIFTPASNKIQPFHHPGGVSKRQHKILSELEAEVDIIAATEIKTNYGQIAISSIHEQGFAVFDDTLEFMFDARLRSRSQEHQQYIEEFTKHQIKMLANHIVGAIEVGATNVATEIHRSMYIPEEKPGWLQRLFGLE